MYASSFRPSEESLSDGMSGLSARALLGWMDREQAVKFLTEDCVFSTPLSSGAAEEIWKLRKTIVESLPPWEHPAQRLPLSAADLKAARAFRSRHPEAESVVDFVRLNPMDLVVHQPWVSPAISHGYLDRVTPDKWLRTALLDPPSNSRLKWRNEGNTIIFDLPHFEFALAGPLHPDGQMRVTEAPGFITVSFHANRALLLSGYHRTFACAQHGLEAVNAPRGVLFGMSNHLAAMGSAADEIRRMMEKPRPPRMSDFFDDRLFLPVMLRRRRCRMRISWEVVEIDQDEAPTTAQDSAALPAQTHPTEMQVDSDPLSDHNGTSGDHGGKNGTQSPDHGPNLPRSVKGLFDEALRHHRAGRLEEAVSLYMRVLFLKPDHAHAHCNVGTALAAQGRVAEARIHYENAVVLNPDYADAHNNLGVLLAGQGNLDDARMHYERAIAIDRAHAEAHNNLGNIFKKLGNFNDAMVRHERALTIRPDFGEAHYSRADIKTFHPGDADLAALEVLADRDDLSEINATFINFALAKALEDTQDYARAFQHLRKANALKRRQINYDETRFTRLFQSASAVFDKSLFDRFKGTGNPSSVPVFVLGMPRSGSSLVEQILASHPQIQGAGELTALDATLTSILTAAGLQYPECVPVLDCAALERLGSSYLSLLPALEEGKARITDKSPGNFLNIGLIRLILPNARIIHTMRDPVDTCISCYSRYFASGVSFSYDLEELGRYYRSYRELMTHWQSVLPPGAILHVAYEDVVNDLEGQARRLIDYCGLPWDDRCLHFHANSRPVRTASAVQVRQPLFRSSLERWRRYESGIAPLLHELGDLVVRQASEST